MFVTLGELEDSFENALNEIEHFDVDATDLSEWLNDQYVTTEMADDLTVDSSDLMDDGTAISETMFDDEEESVYTETRYRRSSRSPPRRRPRQYSPPRDDRTLHRHRSERTQSVRSSEFAPSLPENKEYKDALSKLAASMKRSELSRIATTRSAPQPSPSTLSGLAGLLAGKRTSLTNGLEQSRRQLRTYMSLMLTNQTL